MSDKIAIGVDLGGTKIRAGAVTSKGEIIGEPINVATEASERQEIVENNIFSSIKKVIEKEKIKTEEIFGIGIGSPGPLDLKTGTILNAPNLPSLNQYPLKKQVAEEFLMPVFVENDGNCFALGEAMFGYGNSASIVVGLTLGTGLGCGIVINGRVYHGATGTAAEIWKTPYQGKTFEEIVSGKGVTEIYERKKGLKIDAKTVLQQAIKGEEAALESWAEFGSHLGNVLAFIINLLDPDVIVLGGSISNAFDYFKKSMEVSFRMNVNPLPAGHVKIKKSRFGNDAGVLGAAALCFCDAPVGKGSFPL